ncbi:MAG: APC family permease [Ferroplasma sp.]
MENVGLKEAVMQSFTSIGPMLDFIALFSVIALYSGSLLPFVIIFSFLLSYFTLYTIYELSKIYVTNGGYYSYVGNILGKSGGFFIFLLYMLYSLLTVPNISIFISGFIYSIMNLFGTYSPVLEYLFIPLFIALVYLVVSRGLKTSMGYTLIAGFLEIIFIIAMSIIFILNRSPTFSFGSIRFSFSPFFFGVIFGLLAFSGGGSSIFISENTENAHRSTPKSLLISFTISGIIMSVSAFALLLFAGNAGISSYEANSFYITELVYSRFGLIFLIFFAFFGVFSAFNLSVSYLNAFMHMIPKFRKDFNISGKFNRNYFMGMIFAFSIALSIICAYYIGFFNAFIAIAGVISFVYIIIHIISNFSLIKLKNGSNISMPIISTGVLAIAFVLSFLGNSGYFVTINYFLIFYIIISIIIIYYFKTRYTVFYNSIKFDYSLKSIYKDNKGQDIK